MAISFYADRTVGKLAKWLRILGFDTVSESDNPMPCVECNAGSRIQLTRKKTLCKQDLPGHWIAIESDYVIEQLHQVINALDISSDEVDVFSRCLNCNTQIEAVEKAKVRHLVPDYVWETTPHFNQCPSCQKIFWPGSHHSRITETVQAIFRVGCLDADAF